MDHRTKDMISKSRTRRYFGLTILICVLVISSTQPLHAQLAPGTPVVVAADPIATLQNIWSKAETAWGQAINSLNQFLQTQIQALEVDTTNSNNRQNVVVSQDLQTAADHLDPAGFGACPIVAGTDDRINEDFTNRQLTAAFVQGQLKRVNSGVMNAQELQSKCACGFINTSKTGDPDSDLYKRLFGNCPPPSNATQLHAGADHDIANLIGPYEYLVPNNLPPQQTDGAYQPLTCPLQGSKDYSGFAAAYTFCQNITPPQIPALGGNGPVTPADLIAGPRGNAQARLSVISACYKALTKRMQFASDNQFQAIDAHGNPSRRYTQQYNRCLDDNAAGKLTQDKLNTCQQYGRSDLQAEYDEAASLGGQSQYVVSTLSRVGRDTSVIAQALAEERLDNFYRRLDTEEQTLYTALGTMKDVTVPSSSALSQAVGPPSP